MSLQTAYKSMNAREYAAWKAAGGNRAATSPVERAITVVDHVPSASKAVYGGSWLANLQSDIPLRSYAQDPQARAAQYLQLYRVGWFYKAGSKVARDVAGLDVTLSYEDAEGDNAEEITARPLNVPFARLGPLEQFLRLMERPNPYQTGRTLRHVTQVHLDFTGRAYWFLDGGDGQQLPEAVWTVSPARLTPARGPGGKLVGWVMDRDSPNPVTFTVDEIVPFAYPTAGDDLFDGQGLVEPVFQHAPISNLLAKHEADILSTGGRLAGMAWPKNRSLDEDEFNDAMRAWRNVASDPNAARRLLLFPEPMEFATGAATPAEIGIPELAALSRDEIISAWPIHPSVLGVPLAAGLNSGETKRYLKAEYWGETVHARAEVIEDAIQVWMLPRYEQAIGRPLDVDLEEPNLDDAAALIEKAAALKALTEQGFDPAESISAVGLDHIKWTAPAPMPMPMPDPSGQMQQQQGGMTATVAEGNRGQSASVSQPVVSAKAAKAVAERRERVMGDELPGFRDAVEAFLREQRLRLADEVARALEAAPDKASRKALSDGPWWDQQREDARLADVLRGLYVRLSRSALQVVADATGRIVANKPVDRIVERMVATAAERIRGINQTTRDAVRDAVAEGTRRGYSPLQIAEGVPAEGFPGISGLPAFDPARAELVARTETMLGYNESALLGYSEMGVARVEAIDGDDDAECSGRNGQVFGVEDALAVEDHPNGTLDWIPLTA